MGHSSPVLLVGHCGGGGPVLPPGKGFLLAVVCTHGHEAEGVPGGAIPEHRGGQPTGLAGCDLIIFIGPIINDTGQPNISITLS